MLEKKRRSDGFSFNILGVWECGGGFEAWRRIFRPEIGFIPSKSTRLVNSRIRLICKGHLPAHFLQLSVFSDKKVLELTWPFIEDYYMVFTVLSLYILVLCLLYCSTTLGTNLNNNERQICFLLVVLLQNKQHY